MSTMSHYRPSKRPSVKSVSLWNTVYSGAIENWKGIKVAAIVENGYPFPDFYRVTYTIDGVKKSKLFYGESAWNRAEMFVYDLGLFDVSGRI